MWIIKCTLVLSMRQGIRVSDTVIVHFTSVMSYILLDTLPSMRVARDLGRLHQGRVSRTDQVTPWCHGNMIIINTNTFFFNFSLQRIKSASTPQGSSTSNTNTPTRNSKIHQTTHSFPFQKKWQNSHPALWQES